MIGQADFSGGVVRNVARHLIPENAVYEAKEALLDDDGNLYMRGPTSHLTTSQWGGQIGAVWEGEFASGRQLLAVGSNGAAALNGVGWTSLLSGLVSAAGGGLAAKLGYMMSVPVVVGGSTSILTWGGSKRAGATLGGASPLNVTNGSTTVTFAAGTLPASIEAGTFIQGSGGFTGTAMVASIDSTTQLTLATPWEFATQAMTGYSYGPVVVSPYFAGGDHPSAVAVCQGRFLFAAGKRVYMSATVDPATGGSRPWTFAANDFHEFPAPVIALATLRDRVFVFTKAGIYVITNVGLRLVDDFGNAQQRVDRVSGDVILRSGAGLAPWRDSLVIAAVDGVYTLSASGALEIVSRSITPIWQGLAPVAMGQIATFRDHVFIPFVANRVLVGRLDRQVSTPAGKSAPWTQLGQGEVQQVACFATRDPTGTPALVGGFVNSGYLGDITGVFSGSRLSAAATAADADGSAYGIYVETREFLPSGGLTPGFVQQLMLDYESSGGTVAVLTSKMERATPTASPVYTAVATAPAGNYSTQAPRAVSIRKSARRLSFVFSTDGSCSGLRLRGFTASVRERGWQR